MASFWRYRNLHLPDPSGDDSQIARGWAVPWSVDDLARRHWYVAVEKRVEPLRLTASDWQRLRDLERPWWRIVDGQRRRHPQVDFWYDELFVGQSGEFRRALATDHDLINYLVRQAKTAGRYSSGRQNDFWAAVLVDFQAAKPGAIEWRAVNRYLGRRLTKVPRGGRQVSPDQLPASWRRAVALASERAAEKAAIKNLVQNWRHPARWSARDRSIVISPRRLAAWIDGWAELKTALEKAPTAKMRPGEAEVREYYWHELTRGLSEAELLLEAVVDTRQRQQLRHRLAALHPGAPDQSVGLIARDVRLLTGRWATYRARWHRQAVDRQWRRLTQTTLDTRQAARLAELWLKKLLPDAETGWCVCVEEEADSWQVRPEQRLLVVPTNPAVWSAAELLPIISHELTHVWQTVQGERLVGLHIWQATAASTQVLAEAGAMVIERIVRHQLGGPDQSREYYLAGLRARRRGADFPAVLAAVARGLARQRGVSWSRVPVEERAELARQAFRRSLRLYRPTLRLTASRRLLNDEQLKYVESAALASELVRADLVSLLFVNTIDLTRWPLCRRLGLPVDSIESFPIEPFLVIIKETVMKLL